MLISNSFSYLTRQLVASLALLMYFVLVFLYIATLLISRSGDIELNPGPSTNSDSLNSSLNSYAALTNSGLSIMNLNIQSLKPKLDILTVEAQPYDILVLTETWLSNKISDEDVELPNFKKPFRYDRNDRLGGGVAIYVRDTLHAIQRNDLDVNGVEAVWVEIHVCQRKLLVGGIYRPPNSNNTQWLNMEHSLDQAFNQHVDNILVAGDFNINISLNSSNKMCRLIDSLNSEQLINSPTHFTEHSSSLIDLMFIKHTNQVISSFVADPFVPNLVRFHCPTVAVLKFTKPKQTHFQRQIWLYDKGDYVKYNDKLRSTDWSFIENNQNLDATADTIASSILKSASESIPNKNVTIRPGDVPWINKEVKQRIRKRNKLHRKAKLSNNALAWEQFRNYRNETTNIIRKNKKGIRT